jgi:hypothetical protein
MSCLVLGPVSCALSKPRYKCHVRARVDGDIEFSDTFPGEGERSLFGTGLVDRREILLEALLRKGQFNCQHFCSRAAYEAVHRRREPAHIFEFLLQ